MKEVGREQETPDLLRKAFVFGPLVSHPFRGSPSHAEDETCQIPSSVYLPVPCWTMALHDGRIQAWVGLAHLITIKN